MQNKIYKYVYKTASPYIAMHLLSSLHFSVEEAKFEIKNLLDQQSQAQESKITVNRLIHVYDID